MKADAPGAGAPQQENQPRMQVLADPRKTAPPCFFPAKHVTLVQVVENALVLVA